MLKELRSDSTEYGVELSYARLHGPIFIPGLNVNYKETLTAHGTGADTNLKMYFQGAILLLVVKGHKVAIPLSNVVNMVFKQ